MDAAEEAIKAARARAEKLRPYFSHGLYAINFLPTPRVPRLACDQWYRVYYNPEWVLSRSMPCLTIGVIHELWHLLRENLVLAKAYGVTSETMDLATLAMDVPINHDIREDVERSLTERYADESETAVARAPLLKRLVYAKTLGCVDGSLWTHYYEHLLEHGVPRGIEFEFGGDCGSGATGIPAPWDVGSPHDSGIEGIDDGDRRDIQKLVADSIRRSMGRGTKPGGYSEWADSVIVPKPIPWDEQLDVAMHGGCDLTWGHVTPIYTRLSRRSGSFPDTVMPAMRRRRPVIVFVGDTSGSMDGARRLLLVRGVVEDLARAMNACIVFVATDAEVHGEPQLIDDTGDMPIEMRGRGGTDMRVGIAWVLENISPRPNAIVVGTDGDTPWPDEEIEGVAIIAAIIDNPDAAAPPPWITRVNVTPEET